MKSLWLEESFPYDGTQLRSLFAYMKKGLLGDSVVAWQGPCAIDFSHMLDGEDLRAQSPIRGDQMLHFVIECFSADLLSGVLIQRLLACLCIEQLRTAGVTDLRRRGDDVYCADGKLSISVATRSPVSTLVHFGVNITNQGTPVKTSSLEDFGLDPRTFAQALMESFCVEMITTVEATQKVFGTR